MKKIFLLFNIIFAQILFGQIKTIPTTGTTWANPLTGIIEHRHPTSTALVDTTGLMYIGAGNLKELFNATVFSRIAYVNTGAMQALTKGASGQSTLTLNQNSWAGSAINSASVQTVFNMTAQTASISSTYTAFAGGQYDKDYSAFFKKYSWIDSNYFANHISGTAGYLPKFTNGNTI